MPDALSEQEKAIVRALQQDLPLVPEPYRAIAEGLGISEEALLRDIRSLQEKGCLKRISIALRHKNVGYNVNVMLVWDIPDDVIAAVGASVSQHPAVTHCYKRNRRTDFPYNFYTMVHAQDDDAYAHILGELCTLVYEKVGHNVPHEGLRSLRELKKIGMKYFLETPKEILSE